MRVLVPVDGSDPSDDALAYALEHFEDAEIVALHVIDPVDGSATMAPGSATDWLADSEERSESVLEAVAETVSAAGRTATTDSVVGRPAHAIVEYAEDNDIDHIVLGSHGRDGLSRVFLGSVAETVVRRAPVAVTVARAEG